MKKRTRISIRTQRTLRIEELNIRCPECGAEVRIEPTELDARVAAAAQVDEVLTSALSTQTNSRRCDHLLPAAIDETELIQGESDERQTYD
jgi:hypothetical protein